jgi:hypothetical protein
MIIFLFRTSFTILKLKLEDYKRIVTKGDFVLCKNKSLENKSLIRFQSNGIESLIIVNLNTMRDLYYTGLGRGGIIFYFFFFLCMVRMS